MLKKVQIAWHEVSRVRLRGNLQSGAVKSGVQVHRHYIMKL